ncbi:MAG: hypothetical protein ACT4PW_13305 [Acidimicrobiia bacterium]
MAGSRLMLLAAVVAFTNSEEFTEDAPMLAGLALHPFDVLAGHTATYGQHPPFLGLLVAVVFVPVRALTSDFVALRLSFIVWEAVAAGLAVAAVDAVFDDPGRRRWARLGLLVLPMGWVTSTVMAQDEVIAAAFVAAALWLVAIERPRAALVVAGAGVLAGKIFLLVVVAVLVTGLRCATARRRAALALAPVVVLYGGCVAAAAARDQPLPLVSFDPDPFFGVNAWVEALARDLVSLSTARASSELLVAAVIGWLVWAARRRSRSPEPAAAQLAAVMAAGLTWSWLLFFHVNPEYYVLLMVPALAVASGRRQRTVVVALATVPWAVNLFYAADHRVDQEGAKARISDFVARAVPGDPHWWYLASLAACVAVTAWAAAVFTRAGLAQTTPGPRANPPPDSPLRG